MEIKVDSFNYRQLYDIIICLKENRFEHAIEEVFKVYKEATRDEAVDFLEKITK